MSTLLVPAISFAMDKELAEYGNKVYALQEQLKMLQAQLAALMAPKAPTSGSGHEGSSCFVPTYDLYLGRTDAQTNGEVSKLQLWLKGQGVFPDAQGTGYYGDKTATAVVRWQKAHGMDFVTATSGVGKMTRAKFAEQCSTSTVSTVISGEYSYSDMTGYDIFHVLPTSEGAQSQDYAFTNANDARKQLLGTLSSLGDSCSIAIDAAVEIANPKLVKEDFKHLLNTYSATFVGVKSAGKVFDICATPNGGVKKTAR